MKVTNLGTGGSSPNEYLDLKLEFTGVPSPGLGGAFYPDAAATTPGLTGSYFNGLQPTSSADFNATATRSGVRVDNPVNFPGPGWGSRSAVGVTGGTDALWDNFSVQWEGYFKVDAGKRLVLATRNDDSARFWIDFNGNGTFDADEEVKNKLGSYLRNHDRPLQPRRRDGNLQNGRAVP